MCGFRGTLLKQADRGYLAEAGRKHWRSIEGSEGVFYDLKTLTSVVMFDGSVGGVYELLMVSG